MMRAVVPAFSSVQSHRSGAGLYDTSVYGISHGWRRKIAAQDKAAAGMLLAISFREIIHGGISKPRVNGHRDKVIDRLAHRQYQGTQHLVGVKREKYQLIQVRDRSTIAGKKLRLGKLRCMASNTCMG